MAIRHFRRVRADPAAVCCATIAVTGERARPIFPDVPTIADPAGRATRVIHYGMVAPAGISRRHCGSASVPIARGARQRGCARAHRRRRRQTAPRTADQQAKDLAEEEAKWSALVRQLASSRSEMHHSVRRMNTTA